MYAQHLTSDQLAYWSTALRTRLNLVQHLRTFIRGVDLSSLMT